MSAAQATPAYTNNTSVTQISTNARIDYVLRFSKHAVLIIDENSSVCSQVSNQFLAALPDEHNAAYIAISPKLNDIQIRCRIIEQLFFNTLFDPEQSLAVTVFNLAKENKKALSIVVENVQNTSLQLIHELSQLVIIAKKSNIDINVVMSGTASAARLVAQHASLFDKSLSILSAETGQILPFNSPLFNNKKSLFSFSFAQKIIWSIVLFSTVVVIALVALYQFDNLKFSNLPMVTSQIATSEQNTEFVLPIKKPVIEQEEQVSLVENKVESESIKPLAKPANTEEQLATPEDIHGWLMGAKTLVNAESETLIEPIQAASNNEIVQAITDSFEIVKEAPLNSADKAKQPTDKVITNQLSLQGLNSDYYLNESSGYVIQLSGFSKQQALDEFILAHRAIPYHGYYRLLENKPMLVLTTEVFASKLLAVEYLAALPESIKKSGAFIKSINTVNNEINAFESSQ